MTEPMRRYRVQKRWVTPPVGFKNEWETTWSFKELGYAQEAARDDFDDYSGLPGAKVEFRVYDAQEDKEISRYGH